MNEKTKKWNRVYALYKGDTFIDIGTRKELAEKWGYSQRTLECLTTPSHIKRRDKWTKENHLILVLLDDEEEEE